MTTRRVPDERHSRVLHIWLPDVVLLPLSWRPWQGGGAASWDMYASHPRSLDDSSLVLQMSRYLVQERQAEPPGLAQSRSNGHPFHPRQLLHPQALHQHSRTQGGLEVATQVASAQSSMEGPCAPKPPQQPCKSQTAQDTPQ